MVWEYLEEAWDAIVEAFTYIISFEWFGDLWDFFSGIFDNLGEFSVMGVGFATMTVGIIYALRNYMLKPFIQYMGSFEGLFWTVATYVVTGIVGYLVGKRLFDD